MAIVEQPPELMWFYQPGIKIPQSIPFFGMTWVVST